MSEDRKKWVGPILQSYTEIGGINHLDRAHLPSKSVIALLCNDLLHLLFPGFFSEEGVRSDELAEATEEIVDQVGDRLELEIAISLSVAPAPPDDPRQRALEISSRFFAAIPHVRALLKTDMEAAYAGDPSAQSREEIVLAYPGLEAVAIQRSAHLLYREGVPLVPRMMTEWAHSRTGIDIHPGAQIGSHFFIDHGTGVVIGETCIIGDRVKLYHGVTLGARSFQKDEEGNIIKGTKRHPQVEDDVTIYPNGIILGGDTIVGARSTIGANVFLMESIPPDTLLVRGEQVQNRLDKSQKRKKDKSTVTVQLNVDEIDYII